MAMTANNNDNDDEEKNADNCISVKDNGDKNGKTVEEEDDDNHNNINDNDFVIRNGFPALFDSPKKEEGTKKKNYLLEGKEPIPQSLFQSFDTFFHVHSSLQELRDDCTKVFTARTKDSGSSYSSGQTYWMPCEMIPRCALEKMALEIFHHHTQDLPKGTFDPATSGAEWWTLVLDTATSTSFSKKEQKKDDDDDDSDDDDEDDDVGMHFDADYGLEAQAEGCMIHPRLATITYLSDIGVPTLILDASLHKEEEKNEQANKGEDDDDDNHESHPLERCVKRGWLSSPRIGKHVAFDGRLLHGAPGYVFPSSSGTQDTTAEPSTGASAAAAAAKSQTECLDTKRYTFLVNIWLNHCPLDAELLEDDIVETLKTPYQSSKQQQEEETTTKKNDSDTSPPLKKQKVATYDTTADSSNNNNNVIRLSRNKPSKIDHMTLGPCKNAYTIEDDDNDDKKEIKTKNEQPISGEDDNNKEEPVGVEETVICQRAVTLLFNMTSRECQTISNQLGSGGDYSSSAELKFLENALQVCVGDEVTLNDDDDDDDDDDNNKDDDDEEN